jgi:hypothetical protein
MAKVEIAAHLHEQTNDFPRFAPDQVDSLRRHSLTDVQIVELSRALLGCQVSIAPFVPMAQVREELTSLRLSLETSLKALRHLMRTDSGAAFEAHLRMQVARADHTTPIDGQRLDDDARHAAGATTTMLEAVGWALAGLPVDQRRRRSASPEPVRKIHDALLKGWVARHRGGFMPPFPFKPSSNSTSDFYEIVATCYAAFTKNRDSDPERAIKAYIRENKADARRRAADRSKTGEQADIPGQ